MEKIIKEFIKSDLDEADFFGVSRENSITLEEHIDRMREVDDSFQQMAQFEVYSIKRKCPWVYEVWFDSLQNAKTKEFFLSSIHFFTVDGRELYTSYNKETESYKPHLNVPKLYLLSKKIRLDVQREQDYDKIQEELREIERIGKLVYNGKFHGKKSISDKFDAIYRPDGGMYVFSDHELVVAFLKENVKNYDKPLVTDKDKNMTLKKILIQDKKL